MIGPLFQFEFKFQIRQRVFQVLCLALFILGFCVTGVGWFQFSGEFGEPIFVNGTYQLAMAHAIISMVSLIVAAVFASTAVLRDYDHNYLELAHTTPVSNHVLRASRWLGAVMATFTVLAASSIGMLFGTFSPLTDAAHIGAWQLSNLIAPVFNFFLIGSLVSTSLFCIVGSLTRKRAFIWVSAMGFFVLISMSGTLANIGSARWIGILADPIGFEPFNMVTKNWTVSDQNVRQVPLISELGFNRLVWAVIGTALALSAIIGSHRGIVTERVRKKPKNKGTSDLSDTVSSLSALAPVPLSYGRSANWRQFTKRWIFELRRTTFSLVFLILAGFALSTFTLLVVLRAEMSSIPQLPTSAYMASLIGKAASLLLILVTIFFGSEIIWREHRVKFEELLHASPVKNGSLMASKWLALICSVFGLTTLLCIYAMMLQLMIGGTPLEPLVYVKVVISDFGLTLLFSAILVLALQSFISNASIGLILGAACIGLITQVIPRIPSTHPLMSFGHLNMGPFSDMNGFVAALKYNTLWMGAYWMAISILLITLTIWLWPRGIVETFTSRLKRRLADLKGPIGGFLAGSLLAVAVLGLNIFYVLNVKGDYETPRTAETKLIYFEKSYGELFDAPVPTITDVKVIADFFPSERRGVFSGTLEAANLTSSPINTLIISPPLNRVAEVVSITVDGAVPASDLKSKQLLELGYKSYRFEPPLRPGALVNIDFKVQHDTPGLGQTSRITQNGSFLTTEQALPMLGLRPRRIQDPAKRKANNLPLIASQHERLDQNAINSNFLKTGAHLVSFSAKVCTSPYQTPFASGYAPEIFKSGTRNCGNYSLNQPDGYFFAFMTGRYNVRERMMSDIPVRIYSDPKHDYNLDAIEHSLETALSVFTQRFGAYPFRDLKLVEFPYARHAQSHAGLIAMGEKMAFLTDIEAGDNGQPGALDLASYVTAHETAHQWFGHMLLPADARGAEVITESLAEYAASLAIEAQYDWHMAKRLRDRNLADYLSKRASVGTSEVPLIGAMDQDFLTFNKGHLAFWSLRHIIGDEAIDGAVSDLINTYAGQGAPYPTTLDLVAALKRNTPNSSHYIITDYLEKQIIWDTNIEELMLKKFEEAEFNQLEIVITLVKTEGSPSSAVALPVSEWVELGLYDKNPDKDADAKLLSLERVMVTKARQNFVIETPETPHFVKIDPRGLLIQELSNSRTRALQ